MFPNFAFNETEILTFALALLRIASFIVSWPVFSTFSVPNSAKILFSLMITVVIFPVIPKDGITMTLLDENIIFLVLKEVFIGLSLGYLTRFFFFAVNIGGNLMATSIGLANAQVFNPSLDTQTTVLENFFLALATLLFLALNGHHFFISGIVDSFTAVPLSPHGVSFQIFGHTGEWLQMIVLAGIKISAPILISLFIINLVMGIIGRAVPQINVLVTSMSVNVLAGLALMIICLPFFLMELDGLLQVMSIELMKAVKAF
jgi:flagellar biosynthesis protein FliR